MMIANTSDAKEGEGIVNDDGSFRRLELYMTDSGPSRGRFFPSILTVRQGDVHPAESLCDMWSYEV